MERSVAVAAAIGTAVVFAGTGLLFAVWASRLPTVRDLIGLSPAQMGGVLLVGSLGSLAALPLAGGIVSRFGLRPTIRAAVILAAVGMAVAATAAESGSAVAVAACLLLAFTGWGVLDVAMNIHGGRVEHALGQSVMPQLHAGFSAGAITGALIGWATASLGIGILPTMIGTGTAVAAAVIVALRFFRLPSAPPTAPSGTTARSRRPALAAWTEPRTIAIGLVVLGAGLAEGAANDWVALAVVDGFSTDDSVGALAFGAFVACMTTVRLVGARLLDRFGRVTVLRVLAALALLGLALFAFAPSFPLAMVGLVLWGIGAALAFPTGMSAASDEPEMAAARVSVVSTIGYTSFLAGPPILGMLAEHVGYRHSLAFVLLPLAVALVLSGATRELRPRAKLGS